MKPCCKKERELTIEECIAAVISVGWAKQREDFTADALISELQTLKALESLKAPETLKETPNQ